MTNKEILSNAIDKAIANGFQFDVTTDYLAYEGYDFMENQIWRLCVFSHSFAKAFWGEEMIECLYVDEDDRVNSIMYQDDYDVIHKIKLPAWQYHLQQMVLEENPIKYLEKFLNTVEDKSFDWKENIIGLDQNLDPENNL